MNLNPTQNLKTVQKDGKILCGSCEHNKLFKTGDRLLLKGITVIGARCEKCGAIQGHEVGNYL